MSKAPHNRRRAPSCQPAKTPTLAQLRRKTEEQPMLPAGWKALGQHHASRQEWKSALVPLERALELAPEDPGVLELLGRTESGLGNDRQALALLEQALELAPDNAQALYSMARVLHERGQDERALEYTRRALAIVPDNLAIQDHKGNVLYRMHRYGDAFEVFRGLIKKQPDAYSHWNNAGNLLRDMGELDEAIAHYKRATELSSLSAVSFSNHLTALHYHPQATREEIFKVSQEWKARFSPREIPERPLPQDVSPDKRLRIGMLSDGFRSHPVGKMIIAALEKLEAHQFELFAYSTNNVIDPITVRIRKVTKQWKAIPHLSDEALAKQIREDQIDILIDLAGHNTGSRMRVIAMQPAPLLVKWVGGLIGTTGLDTIDYLISDAIETPPGSDEGYVEKLIRMPDDYICYEPPAGMPCVSALPATRNGYITLGCFNNAAKVNDVVLAEWARIMHRLPASRLFLKSFQYNSTELCDKVRRVMAGHGIKAERLIVEGSSPHLELLEAYNRVDIALDPWPYSGGLTTCEAFVMGVPVVTLPGPTFAGRHSATHLVNAGMPELVVNSWEEYRERVLELASDLESLATIRQHLRQVLLESPVCDAPRFARHFTTAMRAIWQRYCEGKAPAALTLDKAGLATFEGEHQPVALVEPQAMRDDAEAFRWNFKGKVIVLDNGAKLMQRSEGIDGLLKLGAFGVVAFDPASRVVSPERFAHRKDVQLLPHAALGDGKPATLYVTLDPASSATLEPLSAERLRPEQAQATRVLTTLPINTVTLDSIEGLESLDWLILDDKSDAIAVLEGGNRALQDTLLLQVRIAFQPTHRHQPDFAQVSHWASRHGFRFYRFSDELYRSHLPERESLWHYQATELVSSDALFIPSHQRIKQLTDNQRIKLAFVMHSVFGIKDLSFELFDSVSPKLAESYLFQAEVISPVPREDNEKFTSRESDSTLQSHRSQAEVRYATAFKNETSAGEEKLEVVSRSAVEGGKIYDEIIFVIGCGHSGTTLMASILGAHHEIYSIARETCWFLNNPNVDIEYPREKQFCLNEKKRIVCEKTPRHTYRIRDIQRKFPNAKFLAMLRDGRDVVGSLKNRSGSLEGGIKRWNEDNLALLKHASNKNVKFISYEDLVTDPKKTMQRVFEFLGVCYSDKVFEFYKKDYNWFGVQDAQETDGKGEKNHLLRRSWQMTQPIHDRRGVWKEYLSSDEVATVLNRCSDMMKRLGYPRKNSQASQKEMIGSQGSLSDEMAGRLASKNNNISVKVFGDSHVTSLERPLWHGELSERHTSLGVETSVIHGASLLGLGRRDSRLNTAQNIRRGLTGCGLVVLAFGQVDIELGFYYRVVVKGERLGKRDFVKYLIGEYVKFAEEIESECQGVVVKGVNLPVLKEHALCVQYVSRVITENVSGKHEVEGYVKTLHKEMDAYESRVSTAILFNDLLKEEARSRGWGYFDINDMLSRGDQEKGVVDAYLPAQFDHHIIDSIEVRKACLDGLEGECLKIIDN